MDKNTYIVKISLILNTNNDKGQLHESISCKIMAKDIVSARNKAIELNDKIYKSKSLVVYRTVISVKEI